MQYILLKQKLRGAGKTIPGVHSKVCDIFCAMLYNYTDILCERRNERVIVLQKNKKSALRDLGLV